MLGSKRRSISGWHFGRSSLIQVQACAMARSTIFSVTTLQSAEIHSSNGGSLPVRAGSDGSLVRVMPRTSDELSPAVFNWMVTIESIVFGMSNVRGRGPVAMVVPVVERILAASGPSASVRRVHEPGNSDTFETLAG